MTKELQMKSWLILLANSDEPCRFICHGLITGEKYVFRVRAVNAAGLSQFSPESEPVEVKAAIGECSHDCGASGFWQSGIQGTIRIIAIMDA